MGCDFNAAAVNEKDEKLLAFTTSHQCFLEEFLDLHNVDSGNYTTKWSSKEAFEADLIDFRVNTKPKRDAT